MNKWELDVLVLHILRIPVIQEKAINQMRDDNMFDELQYPVHYHVWEIIKDADKLQPNSFIPLLFVSGELPSRLNELDDFRDYESEAQELMVFCENTTQDQLSEDHGMRFLKQLLVENTRTRFMQKAELLYSEQDIEEFINGARSEYTPEKQVDTLYEPLMDIAMFLNEAPVVPTEMLPLDVVAGGGCPLGTVIGLLGPTGGGKTMATYQIATGQSKAHQHVLVNTYEQGITGDIAQRLCSGMIEVDIEELRKPLDQWDAEHREKFMKMNPPLAPFIHINDMTLPGRGCRGIVDIRESYEELKAKGQAPIYIIVDWLKPMIMRYLATNGIDVTDNNWRTHAYLFLDAAGQFVKETNTIMIVNHQLDTKMARASSRKKPVVTDAMELRSFAFNIDACYLLGNRDKETNIAWLLADKNRRGAPLEKLVRMVGELARFELAEGFVADHQGRFVKEDEINVIPEISDSEDGTGISKSYM